ncbi:synaptic vesicular amine transporter [Drosophila busckii]|nr:synaptic vesicular amine transporter [Drosophila busckii]
MSQKSTNAAAAVELNISTRRSSTSNVSSESRFLIALIVYVALLLDNVLLTMIVPILPDYLASLDRPAEEVLNQQLTYRSEEQSQAQYYMTKHPIPGKSMVNFTLLQLATAATEQTTTTTATATTMASVVQHRQPGGTNASNTSLKLDDSLLLTRENSSIGLLLAMKALVQLIFNPIVGNLSSKCGYRLPIVIGTCFLLFSSLSFAVGESYWSLLLARSVQGIGSACIGVCGMSLVAQHYEEARRSKVMGIILGSIALGVLLGYPFGSILYDLWGKSAPFIILSVVIFMSLGLQLFTMDLNVQPACLEIQGEPTKWRTLLESKMILAIVIAIWLSTSTMAILEPCLPIWLIVQHLQPNKWQLGTVFIPDSVGYFVGTNFFGGIAYRYGQLKITCISLLLVGIAAMLIPSATTIAQLLLPHFVLGLGIGIIDAACVPLLASFVDVTLAQEENGEASGSSSSYGTVYTVQQTSVSLAYCLAPLIGGELAQSFGFAWLMRVIGICNLIYGPILTYLYKRYDPKRLGENQNDLLMQSSGRGSRYKQLYNTMDME